MTIDAYTDTWRVIAAKANEIIEQGRSRLEQNDQSYGESQFLRGRISAMREILEMVKPTVVKAPTPPQDFRSRDRSGI
jgi:hypothetical protein